ncbi:MAG: hypothetical protein WCC93_05000, partial [Chthoniobacterales bacterium]
LVMAAGAAAPQKGHMITFEQKNAATPLLGCKTELPCRLVGQKVTTLLQLPGGSPTGHARI